MKSNKGISRSYVLCPWVGDLKKEEGTDGEGRGVHCSLVKGFCQS